MARTFEDFLKLASESAPQFIPEPWYNHAGDTLEYFWKEDESYADRIDGILTVYREYESKEIVGCKIKGISDILKRSKSFGLGLYTNTITLTMLFSYSYFVDDSEVPARKKLYKDLMERVGSTTIRVPEQEDCQPAMASI